MEHVKSSLSIKFKLVTEFQKKRSHILYNLIEFYLIETKNRLSRLASSSLEIDLGGALFHALFYSGENSLNEKVG